MSFCRKPEQETGDDATGSKRRALAVPTVPVLVDIVGAMGLRKRDGGIVDPYCAVYVDGEEVHRTHVIPKDGHPIWTVKSKSLCLLDIPSRAQPSTPSFPVTGEVTFSVCHGSTCLGKVELSYEDVVKGNGERVEYPLLPPAIAVSRKNMENDAANLSEDHVQSLALRFQNATPKDIDFLKHGPSTRTENRGLASDINFKDIKYNPLQLFSKNEKTIQGEQYFRVNPDPERPKETEWMTREQLEAEVLKPSKRWVSAGHGTMGTIRLEILGADDLPNLDLNINDYTDPFIGIVFEDSMVRTDVIWDNLNPRWMPWSTRAFIFKVRHPTSILMLGVFDYDETPIDFHDPVGRVVINTSSFRCNTDYVLHYKLHHDPREIDDEPRGTIRIRLRLDWEDESEAMKMSFTPAPRFMINVDNVKSHYVLRYLTRGAIDMEQSSLTTVKLYLSEIVSYWSNYCYALDVLADVILWRGRVKVGKTRTLWFPIHSMVLFGAAVLVFERPRFAAPILLYAIAWILLSMNYHASRHPYPWLRVKKSEEINMMALFGRSSGRPEKIEPEQGVRDKVIMERLDKLKAERMSTLIKTLLYFQLSVYRIYSQTSITSVKMATDVQEGGWNFLNARLHYLHMMLKYLCKYIRLFRNFINCKSYSTDVFSMNCIMAATLWLIFPCNTILVWITRILLWGLLGPWMKLIDIYWVHSWFETKEELLKRAEEGTDLEPRVPNLNPLLESDMLRKMGRKGRIMAENSYKKKDMRDHMYGCYCEIVPKADSSRYPSVPSPQSTASPVPEHAVQQLEEIWYHVPGQLLDDSVVPDPSNSKEAALEGARELASEPKKTK